MCLYNPWRSLDYDSHDPYNRDFRHLDWPVWPFTEIPSDLFKNRGTRTVGKACLYLVSSFHPFQGKFFKTYGLRKNIECYNVY